MLCGERAEPRRQEGHAEAVRRTDAHGSRDIGILPGDRPARGDHVGLHAFGYFQEPFAGGCHLAAGGQPAEELGAKCRFKRRDPAGNSRMIKVEPPRSP